MNKNKTNIDLDNISEKELLETRICDLPIKIKDTWLETCVNDLYKELDNQNLKFTPKCYLADEWLTPDLETVIGIPFFLAHPTLIKLEKSMMLEAEGDTKEWCLKLLRHETGHAINYAYKLYKKKKWQNIFGKFSSEYKDIYRFRPYSKSYVRHLEDYYAQYHPDEDFAETFAVWLTPGVDWQKQYKGWKALNKLKYVDHIMTEIKNKDPLVKTSHEYWKVSQIKKKLCTYYKKKQHFFAEDFPSFHDVNLKKIFSVKDNETKKNTLASTLIRKHQKPILQTMSKWTGEKKYVANDLIGKIIRRCKELQLVCIDPEPVSMLKISTYIATLLMNYLYTGRFRGKKWKKV